MQADAPDDGRVEFVTQVTDAADDGFEHLLNFGGTLIQLGRLGPEIVTQRIQLKADRAKHLPHFVMKKVREAGVIGFAFCDKSEEYLVPRVMRQGFQRLSWTAITHEFAIAKAADCETNR